MLKSVHQTLGKIIKSELVDVKLKPEASHLEVNLLFKTTFEKEDRFENFVWFVNDGKAGLFSYNQLSPEEKPASP